MTLQLLLLNFILILQNIKARISLVFSTILLLIAHQNLGKLHWHNGRSSLTRSTLSMPSE